MDETRLDVFGSVRERRWVAIELLVAGAIVVGANVFDVVPISETPWLVALGWMSLRRRRVGWCTLGLRKPVKRAATIGIALAAALALQLLSESVIEPITGRPDLSDFQSLVGNLLAVLGMLALVWVLAAFGEEMAYRGYLLERAAALGFHSASAISIKVRREWLVRLCRACGLGDSTF